MQSVWPGSARRYEVGPCLGEDAVARVHRGLMHGPAGFVRNVAFEVLHPSAAADVRLVQTLIEDARLAGALRHPNIVSIIDLTWLDGLFMLVLEFVDGFSLSRLLAEMRDPPPLPVALAIAHELLHGLDFAHEMRDAHGRPLSIVHGDLAPRCVLLGRDGMARVTDFGVARTRSRVHLARRGEFRSRLAHAAPEVRGGGMVDRRADVYGAAALLFELLTRCNAQNRQGLSASHFNPAIPAGLDAVIARGLADDPAQRFPTAIAMADVLERLFPIASTRKVSRWLSEHEAMRFAPKTVRMMAPVLGEASLLPKAIQSS